MKSLKLYFSLLLSVVMLAVAVSPAMAENPGEEGATKVAVDNEADKAACPGDCDNLDGECESGNCCGDECGDDCTECDDKPIALSLKQVRYKDENKEDVNKLQILDQDGNVDVEFTMVGEAQASSQNRENTAIDENFNINSALEDFVLQSAIFGDDEHPGFFMDNGQGWKYAVMLIISFVLLYLAIVKKFEPLLLMPIAFGMLLTNIPGAGMFHADFFANGHVHWADFALGSAGLLDYLYLGVKLGIYPCLIFVGVGAMTDFAPLIANPKSLLLGAAAQIGIFATFIGALALGFNYWEAGSIGIIGGADGPTAIYITSKLAPHLLGPIAVAAYSYMALVPVIQPPIMKMLTTDKERKIEMKQLRTVSQREKIIFPIVITVIIAVLLPSAAPLIGCLMFGNLMKECGVTERLSKTVQNELMNIVTIFLGISVGATATAESFLNPQTLFILTLGIIAFSFGSASGVLLAKFMNLFTKEKINPLIGSAGVSAVPMAARVSQTVGQKYNPGNFLLMHAMGPNVAGVIGSAVAAGILLSFLPL